MMPPKDAFTKEELQVTSRLRQMKLSGMADALENQLRDPNADLAPFTDRIIEIVNTEWQNRYDKKFSRFLKQAKLRYPAADLDESIYDPGRMLDTASIERLNTCHWVEEGRNLLITGPTSSGKTYLSNALCISAIRQFKTVRYIRASILMGELEQSRIKGCYLEYIQKPTVHMGPAACQMEKKGIQTNIVNLNRDIKATNSLMQSIPQMVCHLKGWGADLKEKQIPFFRLTSL